MFAHAHTRIHTENQYTNMYTDIQMVAQKKIFGCTQTITHEHGTDKPVHAQAHRQI